MAARECYVAMMEMDDHFQAMNIEEHQLVMKPVEKLEEILIDDNNLNRMTKIETFTNPAVR